MQLSTVGDGYNVDIDLMNDYTWSGDIILTPVKFLQMIYIL